VTGISPRELEQLEPAELATLIDVARARADAAG